MFQDSIVTVPNSREATEAEEKPQKSLNEKQQVSGCKKLVKQI